MWARLLAGVLLAWPWFVRRRWQWGRHHHARIAGRLLILFGVMSIAALLAIGRIGAVSVLPREFVPAQRLVADMLDTPVPVRLDLGWPIAAMLIGGVVAGLVARVRGRAPATLGDVGGLVPRSGRELGWGVLLSVDAGVCEELYFRLAVPLVVVLAGGSAVASFALSAALFGWAHRYQGPVGMAATLVVALLLSAAYLLTGQLWVAMALHVALDVNGLVVRPWVAGQVGWSTYRG